jgi:hypothetical protein
MPITNFKIPLNNVSSGVGAPRGIGVTSLTVATGTGGKFGSPSPSAPIRITVIQAAGISGGIITDPTKLTIFSCTGRSADVLSGLTVIEGTTDLAFANGDTVIMAPTAGAFSDIHGAINALESATTQASVAANQIYAGPTTGAAAAPTFRAGLAADISNFDTQVRTSRLDQMAAPTAAVGMNGQLLSSLGTPVSSGDATTKAYVDGVAAGLDVKASVRATATSNIALTGGATLTVDGIALANGDRVLLMGQTTGSQNGIYTIAGIGSAYTLTRATDADTATKLTTGAFAFTEQGTGNAGKGYVLTTPEPITLGTTALTFAQFNSPGSVSIGGAVGGSPTSGGVLYTDAGGLLAQDPTKLFYDATNKRLGIGTNAPATALHSVSSAQTSNLRVTWTTFEGSIYHDGFAFVILSSAGTSRLNLQGNLFVESNQAYPQNTNNYSLGISSRAFVSFWTRIVEADDAQTADTAGFDLLLRGGASTGTGKGGSLRLQTTPKGAAGSTVNTYIDRYIAGDSKALTNAATSLFDVTLTAGTRTGGQIHWTIDATDGTDHQSYSGLCTFAVVNKGGVYTTQVTQVAANESKAVSAGTLTATFAFLNGTNKVTLQVTPATSLTFTTYRIHFTVTGNGTQPLALV